MVTKVSCGSELLAKLLARPDLRDVTVNLKDQNGWTPLMFAVQLNSTRFVRLMMMDNRVEANIRDNQGNSPLMAAVKLNHVQCVKAILTDARADLGGRDNFSLSDKDASRYTYIHISAGLYNHYIIQGLSERMLKVKCEQSDLYSTKNDFLGHF